MRCWAVFICENTAPVTMPMISNETIISIRVKPCCFVRPRFRRSFIILSPLSDQSTNGHWQRKILQVKTRGELSHAKLLRRNGEEFDKRSRLLNVPEYVVNDLSTGGTAVCVQHLISSDRRLSKVHIPGSRQRAAARCDSANVKDVSSTVNDREDRRSGGLNTGDFLRNQLLDDGGVALLSATPIVRHRDGHQRHASDESHQKHDHSDHDLDETHATF